jgi:hypothetical protein
MTESSGVRFSVEPFKHFQVTYSISSHSLTMMSTQPLKEVRAKNLSSGLSAPGAYSWQICRLTVPNVEVGMEAKYSIAILSLNAFLRGSFIYTHIQSSCLTVVYTVHILQFYYLHLVLLVFWD